MHYKHMDGTKKLRLLDHSWHLSHQESLISALKEDVQFDWLIQHRRSFGTSPRGNFLEKYGIEMVTHYESGKYDAVILHLDQQCLDDTLYEIGKGSLYKDLNEVITDVPKIVICHGTPYWPEVMTDKEMCIKMKELIGKNPMVVNSYTAKLQWAYGVNESKEIKKRFTDRWISVSKKEIEEELGYENIGVDYDQINVIIHGIDPNDFQNLPKEPRVVTMISPAGLDAYYDRTFLQTVKDLLKEKNIEHCHITVDSQFKNFEEYSNFLGRSLIYFNPTRESCMPRSRTEAMLSGCCVLTTINQDEDLFIENGVNGFHIPRNPETVVKLIEALLTDYKTAIEIGNKGRETALERFNPARYRLDWIDLLNKLIK